MASLRTDSPLARRIVLSFLRFLSSVEAAPGVDSEAMVVASQCLADAFGLDMTQIDELVGAELLPRLFVASGLNVTSLDSAAGTQDSETVSGVISGSKATAGFNNNAEGGSTDEKVTIDCFNERIFEHYREALESAGYFDGLSADTADYHERMGRAKDLFHETVKRTSTSSSASEHHILAEALKAQGNSSMTGRRYTEAIDLYTMAISFCEDNAVYYSNRAAAHTQLGQYEEAMADCKKAIQLDPTYSKAYSRLGLAYYAQGKYHEAIENGFKKALTLDPSSTSIQENLKAAQQKLNEERDRNRRQNSDQTQQQQAHNHSQSSGSRFSTSIPFNVPLPPGMANMFPAVANLAAQFAGGQTTPREDNIPGSNSDGQTHQVRLDVTMEGDEIHPQFAGFMESMLQMFERGAQHPAPQQEMNEHQGNQNSNAG